MGIPADEQPYCACHATDRAESKGKLKLLIFDLDGADKFFLCSFRMWPGAPGTTTKYGIQGGFGREKLDRRGELRYWKQGFTCNLNLGTGYGLGRADFRVDMNIIDGEYEDVLPSSAGGDPALTTAGCARGRGWAVWGGIRSSLGSTTPRPRRAWR